MALDAKEPSGGMLTVALRPVSMLPNTPQIHCDGKRKAQLVDNKRCFEIVYAGNVTYAHILAQQKLWETHGILHTHPSLELIQERPVDGEAFLVASGHSLRFGNSPCTVWITGGHTNNDRVVPLSTTIERAERPLMSDMRKIGHGPTDQGGYTI